MIFGCPECEAVGPPVLSRRVYVTGRLARCPKCGFRAKVWRFERSVMSNE